jgi:hypothetical protein
VSVPANFIGARDQGALYRVYWTRNLKNERQTEVGWATTMRVVKEVREGLSYDDANSLCASVAALGFMPFVSRSVKPRHAAAA